jgi:hypothetical protein
VTILTTVLASSTNSTSTINDVEPGLLGFLVVAALGLALVFLLRSMNKQFKKIGPKPEEPLDPGAAGDALGEHSVSGPVVAGHVVADEPDAAPARRPGNVSPSA